ncbi:DUF1801 domain-containing protein [Candidatus Uhrbacteria bacterium]|nr:DUF1801 domain-containing protein [Candidatus Uhrbacteria bacterium]
MNKTLKTVDAYIAAAPKETRAKLSQLRKVIKSMAPKAEEKISYGMPYYGYKGRLVYFAYAKNHIGFYIMPPIVAQHKKDLAGYSTTKATVRFPLDEPLPMGLIKKLMKARIKFNDAKKK